MDFITLDAQTREVGKRGARAVRRAENIPCVLYGNQVDAVPFQVTERSLHPLIYTNETHRVQITIGSESWDCVVKEIDYHPVTDRPMHADFQVLQAGEKITLTVPIRYEGTAIGQTEGGSTTFVMTEVDVSCLPKDIPSHIDVDVTHLQIGDSIQVGDLSLEGVEILAPEQQTIVTVVPPRALVTEETEEDLLEGLEEGDEAEEDDGEEEES